jgi:aminoglycoside phosphotransferase (APT) family kinase protein
VVATGSPAGGYPWTWGVYRRLEGETLPADRIGDTVYAAEDLAAFLAALQGIDTAGGPPAGPPSTSRGVPLSTRDAAVQRAIAALGAQVDAGAVRKAALRAEWDGPPAWLHGDLMPGNLLVVDGRLSAVIDFSTLCVGDAACDLMVAWMFLTAETRPRLRSELGVDDAAWARGRGWALSCALIAIPYYTETNPTLAGYARRTLAELLADSGA